MLHVVAVDYLTNQLEDIVNGEHKGTTTVQHAVLLYQEINLL